MEARNWSSVTGSAWFGLMPQRKFRRRDNIRLRQILGHANARGPAPLFIIAARGQPHVPCQHYRVPARCPASRPPLPAGSPHPDSRIQPGPAHCVLAAARERRLRQIAAHQQNRAGKQKLPIRSVDVGFWTAGNEPRDEIPWWILCSVCLRCLSIAFCVALRMNLPLLDRNRCRWQSVAIACSGKKYS
jgi:hypothetical protein